MAMSGGYDELSPAVIAATRRPVGMIVGIVATVDAGGFPHLAPIGSVRAVSPREIRFGCDRQHDTFANVVRDGRVAISIVAPPNLAVGIRGRARVMQEHMYTRRNHAIVTVQVEEVKDDLPPGSRIPTGITYSGDPEGLAEIVRYLAEVEAARG